MYNIYTYIYVYTYINIVLHIYIHEYLKKKVFVFSFNNSFFSFQEYSKQISRISRKQLPEKQNQRKE